MNSRQGRLLIVSAMMAALFLSGCASGRKQKIEQREKLAASSGLYCDFVNGDQHREVELELNVLMAKKCDADKPFSITNYKSSAEVTGVLYCCAIKKVEARAQEMKSSAPKAEPKAEVKTETKTTTTTAPTAVTPAAPSVPAAPAKAQPPVDKKATQPQDNKDSGKDLEEVIVPL